MNIFPDILMWLEKSGEVRIELDFLTLSYSFGVIKNDFKAIIKIVKNNRFFFLRKWDEFYNLWI